MFNRPISCTFFVAVIFSIFIHGLVIFPWLFARQEQSNRDEQEDLHIELVSTRSDCKEQDAEDSSKQKRGSSHLLDLSGVMQKQSKSSHWTPLAKGMNSRENDWVKVQSKNNILKSIKNKIRPYWHAAQPPGVGHVELCLKINTDGTISSLWITKLHGSFQLAEFVSRLIFGSGPFVQAMRDMSGPFELECVFHITSRQPGQNNLVLQED